LTTAEIIIVAAGAVFIAVVLWNVRGHRRHGDESFYESWEAGGTGESSGD